MPPAHRHALAVADVRRGRTRWLVVSTRDGRWTLPKGRRDPGESPIGAAVRETAEEAGVLATPVPGPPVAFRHRTRGGRVQTVTAYPAVRRGRTLPAPGERWRDRRWVSADDPRLPKALRAALAELEQSERRAA